MKKKKSRSKIRMVVIILQDIRQWLIILKEMNLRTNQVIRYKLQQQISFNRTRF
jgi:hypothetical protein